VTGGAGATPNFGYIDLFSAWLKATFPNPATKVLNRGIGGATSSVYALCLQQMMPLVGGCAVCDICVAIAVCQCLGRVAWVRINCLGYKLGESNARIV
jgi:hypothetical protein